MPALNHIIVPAKDKDASAKFLADILGVKAQPQWGPFRPVQTSNGVTLDFVDSKDVRTQHYAFLVDDQEFDASFAKLKKAGIAYFADPHKAGPGEINHQRAAARQHAGAAGVGTGLLDRADRCAGRPVDFDKTHVAGGDDDRRRIDRVGRDAAHGVPAWAGFDPHPGHRSQLPDGHGPFEDVDDRTGGQGIVEIDGRHARGRRAELFSGGVLTLRRHRHLSGRPAAGQQHHHAPHESPTHRSPVRRLPAQRPECGTVRCPR
jgi:extradiol dioxygenase family protein